MKMLPIEIPRCTVHDIPMVVRPKSKMTYEQQWCGVWYDCPAKCYNSVLFNSPELEAHLAQARARIQARLQPTQPALGL